VHHGHHCDCGPFRISFLPPGFLKPLILRLLAERPMHGYVIMEQIYERTHGAWRPTPASIYPTLAWLDENGYISESDSPNGPKVCPGCATFGGSLPPRWDPNRLAGWVGQYSWLLQCRWTRRRQFNSGETGGRPARPQRPPLRRR